MSTTSADVAAAATRASTTWRVALATRIGVCIYAAFMYAIVIGIILTPLTLGIKDRSDYVFCAAFASVMAGFAIFASFALIAVVRMHITLDTTSLQATVVDGHTWFLKPHFRAIRLPVEQIASVERRTEIFRTLGLRSMRDALSIVTTGGERIGLFSNTLGSTDTLPLDDVATAISAAAGVPVTDDGTVFARGFGLYGAASSSWSEQPLDPATASKARRGVMLTVGITSGLLLLCVLLRALF